MSTKTITCRSCGAPIRWASTAAKKKMPLDTEPCDPHTVGAQVAFTRHGKLQARPLDVAVEEIAASMGLSAREARDMIEARVYEAFVSHFATCPYGHLHRDKRPRVDKP